MKIESHPSSSLGIQDITYRIFATGQISRADEHLLHQVLMSDVPLGSLELRQIRNVLNRFQMGLLKLVD